MSLQRLPSEKPFCEFMELLKTGGAQGLQPICNHPSEFAKHCDPRCSEARFELSRVKITLERQFDRNHRLKEKIKKQNLMLDDNRCSSTRQLKKGGKSAGRK